MHKERVIGQLQHACAVVKAGRSFLRRMIELSKIAHKPCHYIRLNHSFHSDLMWWRLFLHSWNGISMMSTLMPTYPDLSSYCDIESVVSVLNSRTSKDQSIMHMLCSLFSFEASLGFILTAKHIPRSQSDIADDLSRNCLSSFFTKVPHADALPMAIPQELPSLLMNQQLFCLISATAFCQSNP